MNDVCRFSKDHVVKCSERTVLSCLEQHINSLHPKAKFNMEIGENSQLPPIPGHSSRGIVRTPIPSESSHTHTEIHISLSIRAKKSVITSLFDRAKSIISNPSDQEKEENHLTTVLRANGYPKKFINTIRTSELPRQQANNNNIENPEQIAPVRVSHPYDCQARYLQFCLDTEGGL